MNPIPQVRKLQLREAESLAQGHTATWIHAALREGEASSDLPSHTCVSRLSPVLWEPHACHHGVTLLLSVLSAF